jgi:hypothetical protein
VRVTFTPGVTVGVKKRPKKAIENLMADPSMPCSPVFSAEPFSNSTAFMVFRSIGRAVSELGLPPHLCKTDTQKFAV